MGTGVVALPAAAHAANVALEAPAGAIVTQPGEVFGVVQALPVVELNTDLEDDDPWLSPDGATVVFASDRNEAGDVDLFVAVRTAM